MKDTSPHPHLLPGVSLARRAQVRPGSGPLPGAAGCVTVCHPPACHFPRLRPAQAWSSRPKALRGGCRPSSNPRREGCSETAVSEWFEEHRVTAGFNSGWMTTSGRPARTRRGRVRRSCREGASPSPPRPALPCHALAYPALPCPTLPYPALPCPALPCFRP